MGRTPWTQYGDYILTDPHLSTEMKREVWERLAASMGKFFPFSSKAHLETWEQELTERWCSEEGKWIHAPRVSQDDPLDALALCWKLSIYAED